MTEDIEFVGIDVMDKKPSPMPSPMLMHKMAEANNDDKAGIDTMADAAIRLFFDFPVPR